MVTVKTPTCPIRVFPSEDENGGSKANRVSSDGQNHVRRAADPREGAEKAAKLPRGSNPSPPGSNGSGREPAFRRARGRCLVVDATVLKKLEATCLNRADSWRRLIRQVSEKRGENVVVAETRVSSPALRSREFVLAPLGR